MDAGGAWDSLLKAGGVAALIRVRDEQTVICRETSLPSGVPAERGWRAIEVSGPLDLGLVGILASVTTALAKAQISVFVLSTYSVDLVLVRDSDLAASIAALSHAGHEVS